MKIIPSAAVLAAIMLAGCQGNNATTGNAAAGNSGSAASGGATAITGAGSTFVYPVLSAWSADYSKSNGVQVNYQSIGSGGGIAQIKAGTVDFGATDKPLTHPASFRSAGLAQFPVRDRRRGAGRQRARACDPGQLKLSGPVLAGDLRRRDHDVERSAAFVKTESLA